MTEQAALRGDGLASLIVEKYSPAGAGSRLPTERELSSEFGVSRSTIRRALSLLEARRVISREVGRGTFFLDADVSGPGTAELNSFRAALDDIAPMHVMTARWVLEPRIMPLVVSAATERDFLEMERCLSGGNAAETSDQFEAWDLALHRAIALASHNALVVGMYNPIELARHGTIWEAFKRRADSVDRRRARADEHHAIIDALRARNADAAAEAMELHLGNVELNMFGHSMPRRGLG